MIVGDLRLKEHGTLERRRELQALRRQEWVQLYATGLSLPQIADRYEVHHCTVLLELKKTGIKFRKSGWSDSNPNRGGSLRTREAIKTRKATWERWRKMYVGGMTTTAIAIAEKTNSESVRRVLRGMGVSMRRRGGKSGPRGPYEPRLNHETFVDYSQYRKRWRAAKRVERMLEIAFRKDRAA